MLGSKDGSTPPHLFKRKEKHQLHPPKNHQFFWLGLRSPFSFTSGVVNYGPKKHRLVFKVLESRWLATPNAFVYHRALFLAISWELRGAIYFHYGVSVLPASAPKVGTEVVGTSSVTKIIMSNVLWANKNMATLLGPRD